jgi:ABC-type Fe3+-hydroxamate transport system substrate-binding protein
LGFRQLEQWLDVVTLEQIAAWDADRIFIISYQKNSAEIAAALKSDPQWQALRAVKQNHLYGFPADFYAGTNPTRAGFWGFPGWRAIASAKFSAV